MRCFVHIDSEAVGLCKNCMRGLCSDCAADLPAGLACAGRCESIVEGMDALIRRNTAVAGKNVGIGHWGLLVFYAVLGPVGVAVGVYLLGPRSSNLAGAVVVLAGLTFVGMAINHARWILAPGAPKSAARGD
jgi:hypothetical protein